MTITQRTFLHERARTTRDIQGYIDRKRDEDDTFDVKSEGYAKGAEAVKDIAAFANNLGGDLIVGIDDVGDRANDWKPILNSEIPVNIARIADSLTDLIHPREYAELVEINTIATPQPGLSVVVISIPPYHHLVGFEKNHLLGFPIRTGKKTRWLTFDEVMRRSSSTTRGIYIKLKSIIDSFGMNATIGVEFVSPVVTQVNLRVGEPPQRYKSNSAQMRFVELTEDAIKVSMPALSNRDHVLIIPLEFIRTAWKEQKALNQSPFLSLAVDANILWDGSNWVLFTGALM